MHARQAKNSISVTVCTDENVPQRMRPIMSVIRYQPLLATGVPYPRPVTHRRSNRSSHRSTRKLITIGLCVTQYDDCLTSSFFSNYRLSPPSLMNRSRRNSAKRRRFVDNRKRPQLHFVRCPIKKLDDRTPFLAIFSGTTPKFSNCYSATETNSKNNCNIKQPIDII